MKEVIASPSTRVHALQRGVDIKVLAARLGRTTVTREDVDQSLQFGAALPSGPAHPAAAGASRYWDVDHTVYGPVRMEPLSRFDRVAASNLAAAHAIIPAVTHHDRADLTEIESFRASLRQEAMAAGVKLTTLAFHVKALARTLCAFPRFNASLTPDGENLVIKDYVHIGIAVDTPLGLAVPVIRNADRLGLFAISRTIADLAGLAQARKLRPDAMGGASMTLTNLGGIGGTSFTPIINPPEVAILGITRTEITPIWDGTSFSPRPMVPLDLTYDHRVINGANAARFMSHYTNLLTDPRLLA
jgi:pyruvate dehydrogenase E2 component (dihydrolipoamide acetyltransferase)